MKLRAEPYKQYYANSTIRRYHQRDIMPTVVLYPVCGLSHIACSEI